jgi:hypothetical protein
MIRQLAVFLLGLGLMALVGCMGEKDDIKAIPSWMAPNQTQKPPPMIRPGGAGPGGDGKDQIAPDN